MVLDSQVQTPSGCRSNMRSPFARSAEASFFLQASMSSKHWSGSFGRCQSFIAATASQFPG